jgi:secreted trypsin-like serine protease
MSGSLRPRVAASLVLAAIVLPLHSGLALSGSDSGSGSGGAARVVGGEPPAEGRYPFVASLQKVGATGASAHFCGGSLIDETWVLTAAHCLRSVTAGEFRVVVGATRLSAGDGQVRSPAEIRIAPGYDGDSTHGADVALVRLSAPVDGIEPVEPVRPSERARWEPGDRAVVVGWGVTSEAGTAASDELLAAGLPIQPDAVMAAADAYGDAFRPSDMLGAGPVEGGTDACFGDSGGPLLVGRGSTLRQIGVVSFGRGCGRAGQPGVYSRLGEGRVRAFADSLIPLRVAPVTVVEGGTARFTLRLARASTLPASLSWVTAAGTATAGVDFKAGRGVATVAPGQTTVTIDVPVPADTAAERDETFRLRLTSPTNTWLATESAIATVVDGG